MIKGCLCCPFKHLWIQVQLKSYTWCKVCIFTDEKLKKIKLRPKKVRWLSQSHMVACCLPVRLSWHKGGSTFLLPPPRLPVRFQNGSFPLWHKLQRTPALTLLGLGLLSLGIRVWTGWPFTMFHHLQIKKGTHLPPTQYVLDFSIR